MRFTYVNKLILVLTVVMFYEYSELILRLTDTSEKTVSGSNEKIWRTSQNPKPSMTTA